ncbi:MAG: amidohydrolase [Firmicutes bacterium]|nr:amidohydrolase [Bacillota bacterium]
MKIIDTHMHYGTDPTVASETCTPYLRAGDPDSVIRCLDEQGALMGMLFPHDRPVNPPVDNDYTQANNAVAEAVEKYPERIIGVCRINPMFGAEKTRAMIDHYARNYGFRGIKLVASYDHYRSSDVRVLAPVFEKAEEHNMTVLFHSGDNHRDMPSLQAQVAKAFPNVNIVLAHIGGHTGLWECIYACLEHSNIYVDMAQAWPYDIKIFIKEVGIDRITYGSDVPYQSTAVEQLKLHVIGLSEEDKEKVFWKNAARIWRLDVS